MRVLILALALAGCSPASEPVTPPGTMTHHHGEAKTSLREQTTLTILLAYRGTAVAVEQRIEGMTPDEAFVFEDLEFRAYEAVRRVPAAKSEDEFLMAVYFANVTLEDLTNALRETPDD